MFLYKYIYVSFLSHPASAMIAYVDESNTHGVVFFFSTLVGATGPTRLVQVLPSPLPVLVPPSIVDKAAS